MTASRSPLISGSLAALAVALLAAAPSEAARVDRTVYCEEFGNVSSPYGPAARAALALLEENYGTDQILHVEWHISEHFNNPDATLLEAFYGVLAPPDVYFDGQDHVVGGGQDMYPFYEKRFLAHRSEQSKLIMDAQVTIPPSGTGSFSVDLEVAAGETVSVPHTVKVVIYENDISYGGSSWNKIGRAIAHTEPMTIVNGGETQTVTGTFAVDPFDQGWNAANCEAIAYVQRSAGTKIIQSTLCSFTYDLEVTELGPPVLEVAAGEAGGFGVRVDYTGVVGDDVMLTLDEDDLPAGWEAEIVWAGGTYPSSVTIPSMAPGQTELCLVRIVPDGNPGAGRVSVATIPVSNPARGDERSLSLFAGTPAILLVDDDQGAGTEAAFAQAILDAGRFSLMHDVQVAQVPESALLEHFEIVVWNTGELQTGTLGNVAEGELSAYLDGGGSLFLSSQGFLNHRGANSFAQTYLGVASYRQDPGAPAATGVAADPIGDGLQLDLSPPFTDLADEITAMTGGAVGWLDGSANLDPVALRTDGPGFKTVFMSAPFEGISTGAPDPDNQGVVMERILEWLLEPGIGLDVPGIVVAEPDGSFTYDWFFTVGPGSLQVASFGAWGIENAEGGFIADCFCFASCVVEEGYVFQEVVSGTLTDPGQEGLVNNWMNSCSSKGDSAMTRVLPSVPTPAGSLAGLVSPRLSARPNPFRGKLELTVDLERSSRAVVEVFDVTGRRVRELFRGALPGGTSALSWDGRDEGARARASGTYFVRLVTDDGIERTRKVVLVR